MASNLINRLNSVLSRCENVIVSIFGPRFPPGALCSVELGNSYRIGEVKPTASLKDILTEGFLWGMPTSRRSVEKRLKRKFGWPEHVWKPLKPKTNLLTCHACGNTHEAGLLCNHCYTRVKLETQEMQEAIEQNLGLQPVEKDVIVLYEGEKKLSPADYWKEQRIVELPKKRPAWFHSNLMQPTTQEPADTSDVKPEHLA